MQTPLPKSGKVAFFSALDRKLVVVFRRNRLVRHLLKNDDGGLIRA